MKKSYKVIFFIGITFVFISILILSRKDNTYKQAKDHVDIALVYAKTGTDPEYGEQFYKAATLAQKHINENGGINGKYLDLIIMDSQNSPNEAKTIAKNLMTMDNILAVVADSNNNCTESAASIYEKANIVQITPIASSDEFVISGEYQFSASPTRSFGSKFDAENIIRGMNYKSVAIIYTNSTSSGSSLEVFERTAEDNNIQIRVKEPVAQGQTKFRSIIQRIRQTNPDCLYILADYNETIKILQTVRIDRWHIPVIITGSYITEQPENVIGTSLGEIISRRLSSFDILMKERQDFISAYSNSTSSFDIEFGMQIYDTIMMLSSAAEKGGSHITRESFKNSLLTIKDFNGLLGPVTFDKNGMAQRPFYIVKHGPGRWDSINR